VNTLVVEDSDEIRELLIEILQSAGVRTAAAANADQAEALIKQQKFDVVFCDIHMPGRSGLRLLEDLRDQAPPFVFITGNVDPVFAEKAARLGAVEFIHKPFSEKMVTTALKNLELRKSDEIYEIMQAIQAITGVVLPPEKRFLVESRITRRYLSLGLDSINAYKKYFKANREAEIKQLISVLTTHTTSFFREKPHFDRLEAELLPQLVARGGPIRVWSAAASTGEEIYTLGMAITDFCSRRNIEPRLSLLATDIDPASIKKASQGVYRKTQSDEIPTAIRNRFFDLGQGELQEFMRVKDSLHKLVKFEQMNLMDFNSYPAGPFDVIFLRNVLIYFAAADIDRIVDAMVDRLSPEGWLVVGHSESQVCRSPKLTALGGAIFAKPSQTQKAAVASNQRKPRVLIVDDSLTIRRVIAKCLGDSFEIVGSVDNPIEAEKLLATAAVDVITLDLHMPEKDGITWLKELQNKAHPPIVVISSVGFSEADGAMRCLELGAVDFIEKPSAQNFAELAEHFVKNAWSTYAQSRTDADWSAFHGTLKTMITHAGDTSNLILDPDLDSYYVMDIVVVAIPTLIDRLSAAAFAEFNGQSAGSATSAVIIRDVDLDRTAADLKTALGEDANFYGANSNLQTQVKDAFELFNSETLKVVDLLSASAKPEMPLLATAALAANARSLDVWNGATEAMDELLTARMDAYRGQQRRAAIFALASLLVLIAVGFVTARFISGQIRVVVGQVEQFARDVAQASSRLQQASESLSSAATQQAAAVDEVVSSVEEISAMLGKTGESATQAKFKATEGKTVSKDGRLAVVNLAEAMRSLGGIRDHLNRMSEAIKQVAAKTQIINDIVFETRILSFNASIEAARAGAQGRGFAVVAEEVSSLALTSGKAAGEIRTLLASSTEIVETVVRETSHRVERGLEATESCDNAFASTDTSIGAIAEGVVAIERAAKEQEAGIRQTNTAMVEIEKLTQQNAASAQALSGEAEKLSRGAKQLNTAVAKLQSIVVGNAKAA
jgi:chemotaxis methyl-accepting protein methylase/chemotaxis response regulator CheB